MSWLVSSFEKAFIMQGIEEGIGMAVVVVKLYVQGLSEEEIAARTEYGVEFVEKCIVRFSGIIPQKGSSAGS